MLRLPRFQLHTPATVQDAALLLREHRAAEQDAAKTGTPGITVMLVAGGTDLYPNMKRRQFTPQTLISLGKALPRAIHNGNAASAQNHSDRSGDAPSSLSRRRPGSTSAAGTGFRR